MFAAFYSMAKRRKRIAGFALFAFAVIAANFFFPPPIERAGAVSAIVTDRSGFWLHAFTTKEGRWRFSADLDDIDPAFIEELVAVEDKRFWKHWGVDGLAVARAITSSAKSGEIVSGASTITMQTARLLEPRKRTIGAKLIEMARAVQLELRLTKREILELYLTLAPYGGNLEGVRAASFTYFGREPERLSPAERALLISLPQAPEARRPDRRPAAAKKGRRIVLDRLVRDGRLDAVLAKEADEAALTSARKIFPTIAYHMSAALAREAAGAKSEIASSVDIKKQLAAEALVKSHAARFGDGATAAALIIDNATMEVVASVGSSGLEAAGGWIDLTDRSRSPGSLLKPFIYALAFEDGAASPTTVIDDMPRGFGGYRPENFDHVFRGEVRVRDALQHSLNVPAVAALEAVGVERFSSVLTAAGAKLRRQRRPENGANLALALGGAGISMRDVGILYAALAHDGVVRVLRYAPGAQESNEGVSIFTAQTSERINAILRGSPSLAGRSPALLSNTAPLIAYKTGTSYGYRDAWAAGHADGYTIVVWVGRADGAPRPGETGRKAAAPLLFDLFDAMTHGVSRRRIADTAEDEPEFGKVRLSAAPQVSPPVILYPAPGAEIYAGAFGGDGVVFAASGGAGAYRWYVDGVEIVPEGASERVVWRPAQHGFYDIAVVDALGLANAAKVRIVAFE